MPYKKRYTKKRQIVRHHKSRFNRYAGYAGTAMSTATKALILAQGIKKLMNVEFKFHDVQLTSSIITQTPIITQLTNIPQGDTDITRDGAQVKLTRLDIKLAIEVASAAFSTVVRVIVVHDKQTNQAIYAGTDLLADTSPQDNIVSSLNLDNKYRFQVLHNHVYAFSNAGVSMRYITIRKELDLKLRFDASTPSIADLTSSSLSILMCTNQSGSPTVTMFSRIRYVDN